MAKASRGEGSRLTRAVDDGDAQAEQQEQGSRQAGHGGDRTGLGWVEGRRGRRPAGHGTARQGRKSGVLIKRMAGNEGHGPETAALRKPPDPQQNAALLARKGAGWRTCSLIDSVWLLMDDVVNYMGTGRRGKVGGGKGRAEGGNDGSAGCC